MSYYPPITITLRDDTDCSHERMLRILAQAYLSVHKDALSIRRMVQHGGSVRVSCDTKPSEHLIHVLEQLCSAEGLSICEVKVEVEP